jgi:uncharacterized protein DUF6311
MSTLLSFISNRYANLKASAYFSVLTRNQTVWLSILMGAFAFVGVTGGRILRPKYIDWLMEIDPATSFLGWQFFRHSPIFQFPIGANPEYGTDLGNSIVYSDSIPLFAFLFKPFDSLLPHTFQYVGLWILCCFILQAFFAYKLLAHFTKDKWFSWIGSCFFVLAPVCLFRIGSAHYSLFSQWILLAGFCLYFSTRFTLWRWIVLLNIAILVMPYLLVMAGAIWVADLWQRSWRRELKITHVPFCFLSGVGITGAVMWLAGYFMSGRGVVAEGFGVYRMNLLSMIDPDPLWSVVLRDQAGGPGDPEGFNYLGVGIIALALIAGYEWLRKQKMSIDRRSLVPLLLISIGLCLYALSNRVAIGSSEVFAYTIPYPLDRLTNTFRSSGRMFWPVYYLIYLAVLCFMFHRLERRVAITVCSMMLVVQVADSSAALRYFRNKLSHAKWSSPLRSPLWTDIGKQYKRIIYVLPRFAPDTYMPWAQFASENRMAINFGYFSHPDYLKFEEAKKRVTQSIIENEIDPHALYVFESEGLWNVVLNQVSGSDLVGVLDGFRILAPQLKDCVACDRAAMKEVRIEGEQVYQIGERISFALGGTSLKYAGSGWSGTEPWGTWTEGPTSIVILKLSVIPDRDMALSIEGPAFLTDKHSVQDIEVLVNRHPVETLRYTYPPSRDTRVITIHKSLIQEKKGLLIIEFKIKNPKSPAEVGESGDLRHLGLGLISLQLDETKR